MWRRILAVLHTRNLEFVRDRSALGWNVVFPVLVVFGFAFAFSGGNQEIYKVGTIGSATTDLPFLKTEYINFVQFNSEQEGLAKLRRHQVDLLLDLSPPQRYWVNSSSPKGYIVERVLKGSGLSEAKAQTIDGKEIRYVDWLIAGLLSMNIMFSALFGVGYVIVRYRKNGVLKRLKATPLTPVEFLTAQVFSRLVLVVAVNVFVYLGCDYFLKFEMLGSYWDLLLVMMVGTFCLISLGLVIACRSASEEFAGGMLNFVSWPMMFLSGVWFSLEGTNPWAQRIAQLLPLTHMIDGARAIMTEGATLGEVSLNIYVMLGLSALFLALGSWLFQWE